MAVDRCAELVVAWWAVLKAGGVYVPVDRTHPVERIATVLDSVAAVCVLTCEADTVAGAGRRPVLRVDGLDVSGHERRADHRRDRLAALSVDNTAYVIFTSGSTGEPKGVAVSHAGLLGAAAAQRDVFGLAARVPRADGGRADLRRLTVRDVDGDGLGGSIGRRAPGRLCR